MESDQLKHDSGSVLNLKILNLFSFSLSRKLQEETMSEKVQMRNYI